MLSPVTQNTKLCFKKNLFWGDHGVAQSVQHLTRFLPRSRSQGHKIKSSVTLGSVLGILSPHPPLSLPTAHTSTLSLKNKEIKFLRKSHNKPHPLHQIYLRSWWKCRKPKSIYANSSELMIYFVVIDQLGKYKSRVLMYKILMCIQFLHWPVMSSREFQAHRIYSWQFSHLKSFFRNEDKTKIHKGSINPGQSDNKEACRLFKLHNNSVQYLKSFFLINSMIILIQKLY